MPSGGHANITARMEKRNDDPALEKLEDCGDQVSGRVTRRTTLGAICGFAAVPAHAQAGQTLGGLSPTDRRDTVGPIAELVGLYVDIPMLRFPRSVTQISTTGYAIPGLGSATYAEVLAEAGEGQEVAAWRTRDADGRLWEISHQGEVSDTQFGAKVDGKTDDGSALQAAIDYVATRGLTLRLVHGTRISGRDLIVSDSERRPSRRSFFSILGPSGSPGYTANRQATLKFINHAQQYHSDPTSGPVGIRFEHTATRKEDIEQSGPSSVVLAGFEIIPADRGVGVLITEANNFSISLIWSNQNVSALPKSYLLIRGTTSEITGLRLATGLQYSLQNPLLQPGMARYIMTLSLSRTISL